jgi:hypothetical protein
VEAVRVRKQWWVSKPYAAWPDPTCLACGCAIQRHELDTDQTFKRREVCSRACDRRIKGTQANRGRLRWLPEEQRPWRQWEQWQ